MRVLHVLRRLDPGGIEYWLERLLAAWPRASRPEFHFALESKDFGSLADRFRALGAHLHYCPAPRDPFGSARALRSILNEHGPFRAIHSHTHFASSFSLGLARDLRVPVRISHSHADYRAQSRSWLRESYTRVSRAALGALATARLAVSASASQDLFGTTNGIRILPCAIDAEPFLNAVGRRDTSRFTLVHTGRLVPEKNHEFLFRLTLELKRRLPETRLWLIGDGPRRGELERRAASLGLSEAVRFWGNRSDVPHLLASADLFLFPSFSEGLGLAAVEAQAAGLTVLAAAHLPEEIDWLPGSVQRLALDVPIEKWANAALALRTNSPLPSSVRRQCLAQSKFSMQSNLSALAEIYAG
jgi:glycosyltransferase involved in cell wall biosynthesis